MRLTTVILLATLMQLSAASFGQKLTYSKRGSTLAEVFQAIEAQTGYSIFFSNQKIDKTKKVEVSFKETALKEALDVLADKAGFDYAIDEKNISIKPKEPSLLDKFASVIQSVAKDLTVRGKVVDQDGKPLPNASIRVKGKNTVINTNQNGEFEIKDVAEDAVLMVSYVGYKTLEINLKDATLPLQIKLNIQTGELQEVNVTYSTGYDNVPKERATGSFVQIDNELFNRAVGTNVLDRILNVTNSLRKEFAGGNTISIRGFSTINANKKPLIVVDGFPYEEEVARAPGSRELDILLNNLNPNDVESITILRDAAAASIWGARAGNGVIVINTKRGKYNQKTSISFNSIANISEKPRLDKMNVINPKDAVEIEKRNFATGMYDAYDDIYAGIGYFSDPLSPVAEVLLEARKQNSNVPGYNALNDPAVIARLDAMGNYDIRDDISKYLLRTSVNQQHALNMSGGTEQLKYYGSVGYNNSQPYERGNSSNTLTLNFNNTYRPLKNLELNTYLVYTRSKNTNNGLGFEQYIPGANSYAAPYTRLADDQSKALHLPLKSRGYRTAYIDTASYPGLLDWHYRPLDELNNNDNTNSQYSTRFGGGIKYILIKGLSIAINTQFDKILTNRSNYKNLKNYETRNFINRFMQRDASGVMIYPVPMAGILDYGNDEQSTWNVRGQLNFDQTWNKHQVNTLAGVEGSERVFNGSTGRTYGYDPNTATTISGIDYANLYPARGTGGGISPIPSDSYVGGNLNRFISYYVNGTYSYDGKYAFSGSARIDASNFLGAKANQRYTPLWSSGLSWDISKEDFYKLKWMDYLKLRATYGFNGNLNNKATALATANYNSPNSFHPYHKEIYLQLKTPPNPGLTWERVKTINLGADFGMFNNRINGYVEYYVKNGLDLIGGVNVEATSGVTSYTGNYASTKGRGLDVNLNSLNINSGLKWRTGLNFNYNTDKITDYQTPETVASSVDNYLTSGPILNRPILRIYSYPNAGLDPVNGNPRGYLNGEVVDFNQVLLNAKPDDLVYHGSATPRVFGNIMNTFEYKQFSFSFNISFRLNYFVRRTSVNYSIMFSNWGNAHGDYALRWQKPGDEQHTNVPSLPQSLDSRDSFYLNSSALVINGGQVRLNDVVLSYSLNRSLLKKLPFANANLALSATNLGLLWRANKQGIDPDLPSNSSYPLSRNIALRLNVNF